MVWRSLENEGSTLSNWALSKPSETNTLATSSPAPPSTGSLWQPKQELESGPLVRVNGGLTPLLRLVGMIAWVAFGRPAPSAVVNFALNKSRPLSIEGGQRGGARGGDRVEIDVRAGGEDALVPTAAEGGPAANRHAAAPAAAKAPRFRFMSLRLAILRRFVGDCLVTFRSAAASPIGADPQFLSCAPQR